MGSCYTSAEYFDLTVMRVWVGKEDSVVPKGKRDNFFIDETMGIVLLGGSHGPILEEVLIFCL